MGYRSTVGKNCGHDGWHRDPILEFEPALAPRAAQPTPGVGPQLAGAVRRRERGHAWMAPGACILPPRRAARRETGYDASEAMGTGAGAGGDGR